MTYVNLNWCVLIDQWFIIHVRNDVAPGYLIWSYLAIVGSPIQNITRSPSRTRQILLELYSSVQKTSRLRTIIYTPFFSSVAHVWVRGAKTTGSIANKFGFSWIKFFRQWEISSFCTWIAEIKSFVVQNHVFLYICRSTNFRQYWLSTVYFFGDFNETFRLLFFHAHLLISSARFRWKISKNKICHLWQDPLAATGHLWNIWFITEWIALKFKILTDIKIRFKKNHSVPYSGLVTSSTIVTQYLQCRGSRSRFIRHTAGGRLHWT
jgi:hypothetical protein